MPSLQTDFNDLYRQYMNYDSGRGARQTFEHWLRDMDFSMESDGTLVSFNQGEPSSIRQRHAATISEIQKFLATGTPSDNLSAYKTDSGSLMVYLNNERLFRLTPTVLHYNATSGVHYLKDTFLALAASEGVAPIPGGTEENGAWPQCYFWPFKNLKEVDDSELIQGKPIMDNIEEPREESPSYVHPPINYEGYTVSAAFWDVD